MLGNQGAFLTPELLGVPKAHAQGGAPAQNDVPKLGLIAILVDTAVLNDNALVEKVLAFAQNVQNRVPHSKAIVIGVEPADTPFKIATVLEKFYYEGADQKALDESTNNDTPAKEEDNRLVGTILIGNVPIPVVHDSEGKSSPSLYPYTDFYHKRFVYNHETRQYEKSGEFQNGFPEVWHGVIRSDKTGAEGMNELKTYFDKNEKFSAGDPQYSSFNKRLFYANFPAVEKNFNVFDYLNYKHFVTYLEEMTYNRYNKNILLDLMSVVKAELGTEVLPKESMANMPDSATELIFKKYAIGLETALKNYTGSLNQVLELTGRWKIPEIDTPEKLIALRDVFMMQNLKAVSTQIENKVYAKVSAVAEPLQVLSRVELSTRIKNCGYNQPDPAACSNYVSVEGNEGPFTFYSRLSGKTVDSSADPSSVDISLFGQEVNLPIDTSLMDNLLSGQKKEGGGINNVEDCGIMIGQRAPSGTPALENNSVLVEANRMYNPATRINLGKNDEIEEDLFGSRTYEIYGGCVYNNAMSVSPKDSPSLGPWRCVPDDAVASLFDIVGSREIPADQFAPSGAGRCSEEVMSYRWSQWNEKDKYVDNREEFFEINAFDEAIFNYTLNSDGDTQTFDVENEKLFLERNSNNSGGYVDTSIGDDSILMGTLLWKAYDQLKDEGLITPLTGTNAGHIEKRANAVLKYMALNSPRLYLKPFSNRNIFFELSIKKIYKSVFGAENHIEPTGKHFADIKKSMMTPSIPADGIRYVKFNSGGQNREFKYLNLFRIKGDTLDQVRDNLFNAIVQKDEELRDLLYPPSGNAVTDAIRPRITIHQDAILASPVIEPILWRNLGLDEKNKVVMEHYLNKNSSFPVPQGAAAPQAKPEGGYEVMHISALGNAQGFEFGLNAKLGEKEARFTPQKAAEPEVEDQASKGASKKKNDDDAGYKCGDPGGVEIWEWFEAVQCWIEEEILPIGDTFSLDNSCSAASLPEPAPTEGELLSQVLADPVSANIPVAASMELQVDRKTLTPGERVEISLVAKNAEGKPVIGYLKDRAVFTLSNPALGTLEKNNLALYVGTAKTAFKAGTAEGVTTLTVNLGNLTQAVNITVKNKIIVNLSSVREDQGSVNAYRINAIVTDGAGSRISNVDTHISLGLANPLDGAFAQEQVHLIEGQGSTLFMPSPLMTRTEIRAFSGNYESGGVTVVRPAGDPALIQTTLPERISTLSTIIIPVNVTDSLGQPAPTFSEPITVEISDKDKRWIQAPATVNIQNGTGTLNLETGVETANITVILKHGKLKTETLALKIRTRVDSEDWSSMFAQSLVASLVGFPAGDITQLDSFGLATLYSGKTQAVIAPMEAVTPVDILKLLPNFKLSIADPRYEAILMPQQDKLLLQVIEKATFTPVLKKQIPLDFEKVAQIKAEELPPAGTLGVNIFDTAYKVLEDGENLEVRTREEAPVMLIKPHEIRLIGADLKTELDLENELPAPVLNLKAGGKLIGTLTLNFRPRTLNASEFAMGARWKSKKVYSGISTNDPQGFSLYDSTEEVPKENLPAENYGFEGDNKYLMLFAGGTPLGEALKFEQAEGTILLGDPTLTLKNRSQSSLNYDSTVGRKLFEEVDGEKVISITDFEFNNDGRKDAAVVLADGRVRLFEAGPTNPPYIDRGNIGFLSDGALSVVSFDLKKDGYEDLLIATKEGRLAVLDNDRENITRTDYQLKVGKQLYTLLGEDMDNDGYEDLVTLDSRGEIRIFYSQNGVLPENGTLLCQDNAGVKCTYGLSINPNSNLSPDVKIRYIGMEEPQKVKKQTSVAGNISADQGSALSDFLGDPKKAIEALGTVPEDLGDATPEVIETLPWPEGDEPQTYFEKANKILGLSVIKKVSNKDRPGETSLDLEEKLLYTLTLSASKNFTNAVIADVVPDSLTLDLKSVKCEGACGNFVNKKSDIYLFLSGLQLQSGKTATITYEVTLKSTPKATLFLHKSQNPADAFMDLRVSPPYNNTGYLIEHYSTGPRTYRTRSIAPEEDPELDSEIEDYLVCMEDPTAPECLQQGMDAMQKPDQPSAEELAEDPSLIADIMNKTEEALNALACSGGGCFPMPINKAFLVPDGTYFPNAQPIFAMPTTGPLSIPVVSTIATPFPGTTDFLPGSINSTFRFYISPTLTGGVGLAICWGLSTGTFPAPPPLPTFLPYPPPIGNCMAFALPMGSLPICKKIAESMAKLMRYANTVVSDAKSGIASVNGKVGFPLIEETKQQGGGGLEVSLAINLGEANKFEPPVKGLSNIHLPAFDAIGNVIASWIDRQMGEIFNKLLTLPTFYMVLPDVAATFSTDLDGFSKEGTRFINKYKNTDQGFEASQEIVSDVLEGNVAPSVENMSDALSNAWDGSATPSIKIFNSFSKLEQEYASKSNPLEDIYALVNNIPLIKINEKHFDFKVPWLSAAEINDFINHLELWVAHIRREVERVKALWAAVDCQQNFENSTEAWKNRGACGAKYLGDKFLVDIEATLRSVQENIDVLHSYLTFPRKLVAFQKQLADYIRGVGCYLDSIFMLLGGWLGTIQQQVVGYMEVYYTILAIVKNITEIIDVFVNFNDDCDICTNERNADFGWVSLLGMILPDLPIIKFPKWPDLVLDFSNLKSQISIDLPVVNFVSEPIELPRMPFFRLPDVPDFNMFLALPPLPILPRLPDLPELPPLPPLPTLKLPTLPPPPKLPDIGKSFELIMPLVEKVLQMFCLLKKALSPIPEGMLADQIKLLTNRPSYLTPLDLLKIKLPDVAPFELGFNELLVKADTILGLRIAEPYQVLQDASDTWNGGVTNVAGFVNSYVKDWTEEKLKELKAAYDKAIRDYDNKMQKIQKKIDQATQEATDAMQDKVDAIDPQSSIKSALEEIALEINRATSTLVDYKVVKNQLGVPDYILPEQFTMLDKIKALKAGMDTYSDTVLGQALALEKTPDLMAITQAEPHTNPTYSLAGETLKNEAKEGVTYTSAANMESLKLPKADIASAAQKIKSMFAAEMPNPAGNTEEEVCIGSCLVDPTTGLAVRFIPYFEDPGSTQTAFIPSLQNGKSNVLYNDNDSVYLKKETSLPEETINKGSAVPNLLFPLDYFLQKDGVPQPLMEAVDGIKTVLTQNGSSTFQWTAPSNPDVYGYGIEVERSIRGFDAAGKDSPWPDLSVVLLPQENPGFTPSVLADGQPVEYNTLVTRLTDADAAKEKFGLRNAKVITGVSSVTFETAGNASISLNDNRAVYFDQLSGASHTLKLENGYYHIRMSWFSRQGQLSTVSASELLAPQIYVQAPPPVDVLRDQEFIVPIFKKRTIFAREIFTDLSNAYSYYWDTNRDGVPDIYNQDSYDFLAQSEPKEFEMDLIASQNIEDEHFPWHIKTFKVKVVVPKISLDEKAMKDSSTIAGTLEPIENNSTDLLGIPFSVFRKRWGVWKNLGILHAKNSTPTTPALDETQSYRTQSAEGIYDISGLVSGPPTPATVMNTEGKIVARALPGTGQVEILDSRYEAIAVSANETMQTRVAIVQKSTREIVGNVYYVSEGDTDVAITRGALTEDNRNEIGVTVGDLDPEDTFVARNIPGFAPSFPGGGALFSTDTNGYVAMISSDGSVRLMDSRYHFIQKNLGSLNEPVIFQILDAEDKPLYEIFIAADFTQPEIKQDQSWDILDPKFGKLPEKSFLIPEAYAQETPAQPPSPFSDVPQTDPNYQAILDLYGRRIIQGYADGTFQPGNKITRAEFIKIALGATNCMACENPTTPQRTKYSAAAPFPDVTLPAWYYFCISIAKELGMITGYGDGQYRPDRNISRAEAAAVLLRQSSIKAEEAPQQAFLDVSDEAWYKDYVFTAVKIGLIKNNLGFIFPEEEITRGEFAFMASSLLKIEECSLKDADLDSLPDSYEMANNMDPLDPKDATRDDDLDGLTNAQEYLQGTDPRKPDTDGDGILDSQERPTPGEGGTPPGPEVIVPPVDGTPEDLCPSIPEDYDRKDDGDGCPEVTDRRAENGVGVGVPATTVNKGPICGFLDYAADFMPGDIFMTAITDLSSHTVIFEQSKEINYAK